MIGVLKKTKLWIVIAVIVIAAAVFIMMPGDIVNVKECYAVTLHYYPHENKLWFEDLSVADVVELINLVNGAEKQRIDDSTDYFKEPPSKTIYFDRNNKNPAEVCCWNPSESREASVVIYADNKYFISNDEALIAAIDALFAECFPVVTEEKSEEEKSADNIVPEPEIGTDMQYESSDIDAIRCFEQYQICTADKSWEEALELFKENYVDLDLRYDNTEKIQAMEDRLRGTYLEHKDSRLRKLEIQEQSDDNKVITFYYEYERTFVNDIRNNPGLWSGGGMDCKTNVDGTTTYWCGQMGNIVNDGSHWYYVSGNAVGFGPEYLLDENGEINEGVIDYSLN